MFTSILREAPPIIPAASYGIAVDKLIDLGSNPVRRYRPTPRSMVSGVLTDSLLR